MTWTHLPFWASLHEFIYPFLFFLFIFINRCRKKLYFHVSVTIFESLLFSFSFCIYPFSVSLISLSDSYYWNVHIINWKYCGADTFLALFKTIWYWSKVVLWVCPFFSIIVSSYSLFISSWSFFAYTFIFIYSFFFSSSHVLLMPAIGHFSFNKGSREKKRLFSIRLYMLLELLIWFIRAHLCNVQGKAMSLVSLCLWEVEDWSRPFDVAYGWCLVFAFFMSVITWRLKLVK